MENRWSEIWSKRKLTNDESINLEDLMKADGFDSFKPLSPDDWREYCSIISKKLDLKSGSSVYEVGCGAGAFLFALNEIQPLVMGGNDYSPALIEIVRKAIPGGKFDLIEANKIDTEQKYDFVVSNGIFQYLTTSYAIEVVHKMLAKSNLAIGIFDIPDIRTKEASEKNRRDILSEEVYKKKYEGLEHNYYQRELFENIAREYQYNIEIFNQCIPNYAHNNYRFGFIIKKT